MKLCLLRSGSSGNCTVIRHNTTTLLLDAGGLSQAGLRAALAEIDVAISEIDAVVVSHLHSDHINHAAISLFGQHTIPVWINVENISIFKNTVLKKCRFAPNVHSFAQEPFTIKDIELFPFLVDHDAHKTTNGFKFRGGDDREAFASYATDLGCFPDGLLPHFINSRIVILEANHDTELLWNNPFRPGFHKQRVASDRGHLSNVQAAQALIKICLASNNPPQNIVLSHLSKDHNSPEMAIEYIGNELKKCGFSGKLLSAFRDRRTEFIEV
jgi:phosphoribosyl 1,2-cyclic phosphodiesterase